MRKLHLLSAGISFSLFIGLSSCTNRSAPDKEIINEMKITLTTFNQQIHNSSKSIITSMDEKKLDPTSSTQVARWYPKAIRVASIADSCYDYLDSLKKMEVLTADESLALFNKMKHFETDILETDESFKMNFASPRYTVFFSDTSKTAATSFHKKFFANAGKDATDAYLTKLQSSIRNLENKIISVCEILTFINKHDFPLYRPILYQNSSNLKKGETLEIVAAIGAFSKSAIPKITIKGRYIPLNEAGYSSYQQKVPAIPGNYEIPVKIKYLDEEGKENIIKKNITYTVVKDCNK